MHKIPKHLFSSWHNQNTKIKKFNNNSLNFGTPKCIASRCLIVELGCFFIYNPNHPFILAFHSHIKWQLGTNPRYSVAWSKEINVEAIQSNNTQSKAGYSGYLGRKSNPYQNIRSVHRLCTVIWMGNLQKDHCDIKPNWFCVTVPSIIQKNAALFFHSLQWARIN